MIKYVPTLSVLANPLYVTEKTPTNTAKLTVNYSREFQNSLCNLIFNILAKNFLSMFGTQVNPYTHL